jgi:heterodisulfide reductase subunit A
LKNEIFFKLINRQSSIHKGGKMTNKSGSVMVVGAGIAGMQAALDLANSEYKVYLVDKSPTVGGMMSRLDKTFPTNDCAM